MFVHCVYFWLRDDLSPADRDLFVEGASRLTTIDTVLHGYLGVPAGTDRPIIDRTYSYGLVCVFEDRLAHDSYQVDPVHDEFRDTCSSFWEAVKIYDLES